MDDQEVHLHRFRIAEPDGRKLLPAACECGATRLYHCTDYELSKKWRHGTDNGGMLGMGAMTDLRGAKERARKPPKR